MSDLITEYEEFKSGRRKSFHGANVVFKLEAVEDTLATEKEGRPIFKDVEIIEVRYPGEGPTVLEVTDKHKKEYSELYQAFKAGQEQPTSGTPLEQWPLLSKAFCNEFKALGVRTVEQLAEANDNLKRRMRSGVKYCEEAASWLALASSPQNQVASFKKENERLQRQIETLQNQVGELLTRIDMNEGTDMSGNFGVKERKPRQKVTSDAKINN